MAIAVMVMMSRTAAPTPPDSTKIRPPSATAPSPWRAVGMGAHTLQASLAGS